MILTPIIRCKHDLNNDETEKLISSHNKMNDGAKKGDFLGQEKLILGHNVMNYGPNRVTIWDRRI